MNKKILAIGLTSAIIFSVISLVGSASELEDREKFIGTWTIVDPPGEEETVIYKFFSNDNFRWFDTENLGGYNIEGTWELVEEQLVLHWTHPTTKTEILDYSFSDSDQTLILTQNTTSVVLSKMQGEVDDTDKIIGTWSVEFSQSPPEWEGTIIFHFYSNGNFRWYDPENLGGYNFEGTWDWVEGQIVLYQTYPYEGTFYRDYFFTNNDRTLTLIIGTEGTFILTKMQDEVDDTNKIIGSWSVESPQAPPEWEGTVTWKFYSNGSYHLYDPENLGGYNFQGNWDWVEGQIVLYQTYPYEGTFYRDYYFTDDDQTLTIIIGTEGVFILIKMQEETGWLYGVIFGDSDDGLIPLEEVKVYLIPSETDTSGQSDVLIIPPDAESTFTNENGEYEFNSVQPGTYMLKASDPNKQYSWNEVFIEIQENEGTETNIILSKLVPGDGGDEGRICVKAYTEIDGEQYRISPVTIWFSLIRENSPRPLNFSKTHYWAEESYCTYVEWTGTCDIWVTATGYIPSEVTRVEITSEEGTELIFILTKSSTTKKGWAEGTVYGTTEEIDHEKIGYDPVTGEPDYSFLEGSIFPLQNAKVSVISRITYEEITSTYTDKDGNYNISLEIGEYTVIASRQGESYTNGRKVEVKDNKTSKTDFYLEISETRLEIENSIANGLFGGEINVQKGEDQTFDHEIVIYDGVEIEPVEVTQERISIIVSGDENSTGKTIAINVDQHFTNSQGEFTVEYDGELIETADDINDILNPNDDGSHPEYLIIMGANGMQILISVPHFSEHIITISSVIEAIGGATALVLYIAIFSILGILYIAPFFLVRKSR